MRITQYQVDAFATRVFEGNPAAVCLLESWPEDGLLQAIAAENNLSETAFVTGGGGRYQLRWFTPVAEVPLCGHATLAAAHVLFRHAGAAEPALRFATLSGELLVSREGAGYRMDFPAQKVTPCPLPEALVAGLGRRPLELYAAEDYLAVFDSEEEVRAVTPNFERLGELGLRGVIVTAPGRELDFVSRFFAPKLGIPEDPVTGSAHCALAPYWAKRLEKGVLKAAQLSRRGGRIDCEVQGDRVVMAGMAVTFMKAEIVLET
ncbi:putative isomerase [Geomonas limicola]|uniref:Putative isomerase n=1 Tax=Geomonas limicola TaxID=2740186 RepID=A0A6V8N6I5_9BACT|nr:PhzF family phenazine biosynthesis protein [Geomonas limicola]GFO67173.1 putative isomerase [Geomonas limicola]